MTNDVSISKDVPGITAGWFRNKKNKTVKRKK